VNATQAGGANVGGKPVGSRRRNRREIGPRGGGGHWIGPLGLFSLGGTAPCCMILHHPAPLLRMDPGCPSLADPGCVAYLLRGRQILRGRQMPRSRDLQEKHIRLKPRAGRLGDMIPCGFEPGLPRVVAPQHETTRTFDSLVSRDRSRWCRRRDLGKLKLI
jgi:hypothetical protein